MYGERKEIVHYDGGTIEVGNVYRCRFAGKAVFADAVVKQIEVDTHGTTWVTVVRPFVYISIGSTPLVGYETITYDIKSLSTNGEIVESGGHRRQY